METFLFFSFWPGNSHVSHQYFNYSYGKWEQEYEHTHTHKKFRVTNPLQQHSGVKSLCLLLSSLDILSQNKEIEGGPSTSENRVAVLTQISLIGSTLKTNKNYSSCQCICVQQYFQRKASVRQVSKRSIPVMDIN